MVQQYDVVVVGGGAAGLSGALALSRARRSVLVVDGGAPRNAPATEMHNYLGRDGTPPSDLLETGRKEVAGYGGEVIAGEAVSATRTDGGFTVALADGRSVGARRLLVTTGLVDELPAVPGLAERWGHDVLHCPYCHGWEVRDQAIGVLSTGPGGALKAQLWRQWSADVTLFLHTGPEPTDEEWEQLPARGIAVVTGEVAAVESDGDRLTGVRLASGQVVPRDALVVSPAFTARSGVLASLGLTPEPVETMGHTVGSAVPSNPGGATAVPGVWVAGNVTDLMAQVVTAAGAGLMAGGAINADLLFEDVARAVAARTEPPAHVHTHPEERSGGTGSDHASWEERYREAPALWSGRANAPLVAEAADLTPGRALDVGCGEGGDVLWLAGRGWQVTGLDWSEVALARAAEHAAAAGVTGRVEWVRGNVMTWEPPAGAYDLVTAHFLHPTAEERSVVLPRLAAAVAPGGTLLWVGHAFSQEAADTWGADRFCTAAEIAAALDPDQWEVVVAEARPRPAHEDSHHPADEIVRARRR